MFQRVDEWGGKILPTPKELAADAVDCDICHEYAGKIVPSHGGSVRCRNKTSLASGGTYHHCTCSACF